MNRFITLSGVLGLLLSSQIATAKNLHLPKPPQLGRAFVEDLQNDRPGMPYRFAIPYNPGMGSTLSQGEWSQTERNSVNWTMTITADSSKSLNIGFSQFYMPRSGSLSFYTLDGQPLLRPFTAADNEYHGQLWTPPMDGTGVILRVTVSPQERQQVRLQIGVVNYGYRDFTFRGPQERSGSCNVDVMCNRELSWNDPIRAVAAITLRGTDTCTGFLVNNTAQDRRMLFMTAHHCGLSASNAPSLVAIWNYQNTVCREPNSVMSGQRGDGKRDQFHSGAVFRASDSRSDFAIVELDDPADPKFGHFWAGWDRSGRETPHATAIHHPAVAEKRISFSQMPTTTTSYLGNDVPGAGTHVRVTAWSVGTTEPGSSGSPLFDANRRVIGQLHGGGASCSRMKDSDWYGRLSVSWEGRGTPDGRLKDWLDPMNAGVPAIDGIGMGNSDRIRR